MGTRGGVSVAVPLLHLLTAGPATGPAGNGGLPGAIMPRVPGRTSHPLPWTRFQPMTRPLFPSGLDATLPVPHALLGSLYYHAPVGVSRGETAASFLRICQIDASSDSLFKFLVRTAFLPRVSVRRHEKRQSIFSAALSGIALFVWVVSGGCVWSIIPIRRQEIPEVPYSFPYKGLRQSQYLFLRL